MEKPIVQYSKNVIPSKPVGAKTAILWVIDHPSYPPNTRISTGDIIAHDADTGTIETAGAIFVPFGS